MQPCRWLVAALRRRCAAGVQVGVAAGPAAAALGPPVACRCRRGWRRVLL